MHLAALLAIPLGIGAGFYYFFRDTVTWKEFLLQLGIGLLISGGGFAIGRYGAMNDVEHWNGRITAKDHGSQGCCHCTDVCTSTDSDGNCTSTVEVCSHTRDYWWNANVSTGDKISDGCNGSSSTPKWWHAAYVGEPATVEHTYTNYLKADPDSLFERGAYEEHLAEVPEKFPGIFERYRSHKIVAGRSLAPPSWEKELREINADLGHKKQVDLSMYMTTDPDPHFAEAVESKWLYGPKNAAIVVVGTPDKETIQWARVVTISRVEEFKIHVRDGLIDKKLDDPAIMPFLRNAVEDEFERTPMSTFEYLSSAAEPSTGWLILLYILAVCGSLGLGVVMHKNDVFGDEG